MNIGVKHRENKVYIQRASTSMVTFPLARSQGMAEDAHLEVVESECLSNCT